VHYTRLHLETEVLPHPDARLIPALVDGFCGEEVPDVGSAGLQLPQLRIGLDPIPPDRLHVESSQAVPTSTQPVEYKERCPYKDE
jgi:hypothetical protein